ncbi:MAG: MBL fold metallo-hydrolase, partial [Dehalococcoidia bacterium]
MGREPIVVQLRHGPFWNFSYLVGIPGAEAMVVDPAWDVPGILAAAAAHDMQITHAAVTHGHYDHAHGLAELVEQTGAAVFTHVDEAALLGENFVGELLTVGHGDDVQVGRLSLRFLHTPGHTPGSVSILARGTVFTGDTLMTASRGRHGSHDGAAEQLNRSLADVLGVLAPETTLYPGHDAGSLPS